MSAAPKNTPIVRHSAARPCAVCEGHDGMPRGQSGRCHGFVSGDYVHCSREEHAGAGNAYHERSQTWSHRAEGDCPCGQEHQPAIAKPGAKAKFIKAIGYEYRDKGGTLLYEVERSEDKRFRQRRPDPTEPNGWAYNLKGIVTVPFMLPELAATDPGQTVYVVEGEKDVLRLHKFGLVATTNSGGAGKWRDQHSAYLAGRDVAIFGDNDQAGRDHAEQVARSLHGVARSVKVVPLPDVPEKGDVSDWLNLGNSIADLKVLVTAAPVWTPDPKAAEAPTTIPIRPPDVDDKEDGRPIILITTREKHVNDQAIAAIARDPELYYLGQVLATVIHGKAGKSIKGVEQPDGPPPRLAPIEAATLRERMAHEARWMTLKPGKDGEPATEKPAHPPAWSVPAVLARGYWPGVKPIKGVVESPTMRPDGSILAKPGYDPVTALFYHPSDDFPAILDKPTLAHAQAAAQRLLSLIVDFPTVDGHQVVWLAALLTVVGRSAVDGPTPLFAFDGNCPGTGKSFLADLIAIIATLRRMARTIWPHGRDADEEMRKRITALLLTGELTTLLDNVALGQPLGGAPLDAVLTSTTWKDRILGKSQTTPELPNRMVWFATGNNLAFGSDILRRVIPCRLVTNEERPEDRENFQFPDLVGHVKAKRSGFLVDALTILRAYHVAGRPDPVKPLGGYEAWSKLIASAVKWATGFDPLAPRVTLAAEDVGSQRRQALFEGLAKLPTIHLGITASEIREAVIDKPSIYIALRDSLMELSRNDELPTPRIIGTHLRTLKDRVVGTQKLTSHEDSHTKIARWKLVAVAGSAGSAGSYRGSFASENQDSVYLDNARSKSRTQTPQHPADPASDREVIEL